MSPASRGSWLNGLLSPAPEKTGDDSTNEKWTNVDPRFEPEIRVFFVSRSTVSCSSFFLNGVHVNCLLLLGVFQLPLWENFVKERTSNIAWADFSIPFWNGLLLSLLGVAFPCHHPRESGSIRSIHFPFIRAWGPWYFMKTRRVCGGLGCGLMWSIIFELFVHPYQPVKESNSSQVGQNTGDSD